MITAQIIAQKEDFMLEISPVGCRAGIPLADILENEIRLQKHIFYFQRLLGLKCMTSSGKNMLFLRSKLLKSKKLDLKAWKKPENRQFSAVFNTL